MPMFIDLRVGDELRIGPDIAIRLVRKADRERGGRLRVEAPRDMKITRMVTIFEDTEPTISIGVIKP